ncbi:MAG: helix-turn-helix transcriptional regulator [Ruminococcaceae bacterium]|nr:helix-turn-helix transcriptional regulator [Oscillospiraceae bacterium]
MNNELLLPTKISCGYFDCSSFSSLKVSSKRICTIFEIEYFLEDGKNTFSNGIAYPIRRGYVRISVPGEERYSELPFKTKYVKFVAEGQLADILRNAPKYFYVTQGQEALALLDEIITLHTTQRWDRIRLHGKLLCYLSLLLENANRPSPENYKCEIVRHAEKFIKKHFGAPIKLRDVAKAVGLSPNYFHTVFSEAMGLTPREYLEEYRIKIAKKLLLTTQLTLCEIAEQCGFHTQQYLTTVFKSKLGCSPSQFRNQHQSAYVHSFYS